MAGITRRPSTRRAILRNSGFKLAPVDTNLFPGGFNNLNPAFLPLCVQAAMSAIEKFCPEARSLLLIPENHTRNQFYLQNVAQLVDILRQTGLNIRLRLDAAGNRPSRRRSNCFYTSNGQEPAARTAGPQLATGSASPASSPAPSCSTTTSRPASRPSCRTCTNRSCCRRCMPAGRCAASPTTSPPTTRLPTTSPRKSASIPWRINPAFSVCRSINFHERQGEECLAANVAAVLDIVKEKYKEYGIDETPYVVVKADAGTYGMGVMTVRDADEVIALNRKQRNKMSVVKEGLEVSEVLIQEGVHSFETLNEAVAEPVIYMIDRYVVGGFYRVHTGRGKDENLNAPGMHFEPLAFETGCNLPDYRCGNPRIPPPTVSTPMAWSVASPAWPRRVELERTAPENG